MRFCQKHWDMLRKAIKERGLWPLVARNGEEAIARAKEEVEGTATEVTYDPLMACHWMITSQALKFGGLYLLQGEYCPICEAMKNVVIGTGDDEYHSVDHVESDWINGPADAVLVIVKESEPLMAILGWDNKEGKNEQ